MELLAPELTVSGAMTVQRVRAVPPSSTISVAIGTRVEAADAVAVAPGKAAVHVIPVSSILGVGRGRVPTLMKFKEGDCVEEGVLLAESSSLFGLFKVKVISPCVGVVESISGVSGHAMIRPAEIPVPVLAHLCGEVVAVDVDSGVTIESEASVIQGAFGIGGEVVGRLERFPDTDADIAESLSGAVLFTPGALSMDMLQRAVSLRAGAIVASSVDGEALTRFSGRTINLAATGEEDIGIVLLLTEGFGELPMARRTESLLQALCGQNVSVSGVTQVRAGVIRPELIGPPVKTTESALTTTARRTIQIGTRVRVVRGPFFGREGVIEDIPSAPQLTGAGITVLVFKVKLDSGEVIAVPRPNVEL